MNHFPPKRTTSRARWLIQLTSALDEAQHLLSQLMLHGDDPKEARQLRQLVLALSCEIELLRSEGFADRRALEKLPLPPNWRGGNIRP